MKHLRHICPDACDCPLCTGGLFQCTLCGSAEGELTTDCPGELVHPNNRELVLAGELNYSEGWWVFLGEPSKQPVFGLPKPLKNPKQ